MFAFILESLFESAIKWWIFGALIAFGVAGCVRAFLLEMNQKYVPAIPCYSTKPMFTMPENYRSTIRTLPMYLEISANIKMNRKKNPFMAIPYEKLIRFEFCGEIDYTGGRLEIPDCLLVGYEDEQGVVQQLCFRLSSMDKRTVRGMLVSKDRYNVFKLAEQYKAKVLAGKQYI